MKKPLEKLSASACVFRLIYRHEPVFIVWSALRTAVNSVLPLLYVYAPKLILETLTGGVTFAETLRIILLYGAVLLTLKLCDALFTEKASLAADRFAKKLRYEIGRIAMSLSLSELERASTSETVNLAKNASAVTETMSYIGKTVSNVITISGLAYLIARLDAVCLLSALAVAALRSLLAYIRFRYMEKARHLSAQNERVGNYLMGLAYFEHGAEKELRVGGLQGWFMGKISAYRGRMVTLQYRDFGCSALFEAVIAAATAAQSFAVLLVLADNYVSGGIGIADFTMLFAAVTSLTAALSSFGDQASLYNRQVLNVGDYEKLDALRADESGGVSGEASAVIPEYIGEIAFDDVCFSYPGSATSALSNVNIRIHSGEKLVIVGLNGAGKSTFIKLLCKFYKPTSGRITINGIDIWSIPNDGYYPLLAAVFQDYANLAFTMREDVVLSELGGAEKAASILRGLGMDAYADRTDTFITKSFSPDGVELSGGEGQKLAIARAICRDAPLLILDEPTASLDARSESEIYESFFKMSRGRTTIFISHRLAAATAADRAAVFEGGRIVEYGGHAELLRRGGLYAEMYKKQSEAYTESGDV